MAERVSHSLLGLGNASLSVGRTHGAVFTTTGRVWFPRVVSFPTCVPLALPKPSHRGIRSELLYNRIVQLLLIRDPADKIMEYYLGQAGPGREVEARVYGRLGGSYPALDPPRCRAAVCVALLCQAKYWASSRQSVYRTMQQAIITSRTRAGVAGVVACSLLNEINLCRTSWLGLPEYND